MIKHILGCVGVVALFLGGSVSAQYLELSEVLAALDEPAQNWGSLAVRCKAEGELGLQRLLALRPLLEQQLQAESIEARMVGAAKLDRLDQLIDLVAGQPHAAASRLFWYGSLEAAVEQADRSHRPVLIAGLPEGEQARNMARLFAVTFYANQKIGDLLRERFVLCSPAQPRPTGLAESVVSGIANPFATVEGTHIVVDATGRPVHAFKGFCTSGTFLNWLKEAESLAQETYQLSREAAERDISQRHRDWLDKPRTAREEPVSLDMASRLLFAQKRPWWLPNQQGDAREVSQDELQEFLLSAESLSDTTLVHRIFQERTMARSIEMLQLKLMQTNSEMVRPSETPTRPSPGQ